MADTKQQLSRISIGLHWVVGLMMISLLAVGIYMEENEAWFLYPWHKSFGVLILLFSLPRVIWRLKNGWPQAAGQYKSYEQLLSKIAHWVLIIATVMMPISGMLMSGAGGHGIVVFGLELFASNHSLVDPSEIVPLNKSLAGLAHTMHGLAGKVVLVTLALHVIGALKHHVIDKDGTLRRMLGAKI